jgi:hypothetical protein
MNDLEKKLRDAINRQDAKTVSEICDFLRFERKMNYNAQIEFVSKIGCSTEDFEELLYEADRSSEG